MRSVLVGSRFLICLISVLTLSGCQAVQTVSTNRSSVPGTLVANPSSVSFGNIQVGSSQSKTAVLTNSGTSSITISHVAVTGAGFQIGGINAPLMLNPGQSLTYTIGFTPSATGHCSGNIAVSSNASNTGLNVGLSGSGTAPGQVALSPTSLNFGNVAVGTTHTSPASLTAMGGSVTITSVDSNNPEFSFAAISLPMSLAGGQTANFTIKFSPQLAGSSSGTLSFGTNASNSPVIASLIGTGVAPLQHSVSLSWAASTSAVVGYNVYRGHASGGPYARINSGLDPSTGYIDNTVQGGQNYFYVTTAVDASNNESVYSNEVQAVIPLP